MRRHDIRTGGIYYGTADYKTDINWRWIWELQQS